MPWTNPGHSFARTNVTAFAPLRSGVYVIYVPSTAWVYVGESGDIQTRLLQHLNESDTCIKRYSPLAFSYEEWPAESRVARQDGWIVELTPVCNQRLG